MTALVSRQRGSEESLPSPASLGDRLSIVDILDRILDKGLVINGEITVSLVGTELLSLKINLVIASIETAKRYGIELPWEKWQREREYKEQNDEQNNKKMITFNKKRKNRGDH
jgi:hypothetical protein